MEGQTSFQSTNIQCMNRYIQPLEHSFLKLITENYSLKRLNALKRLRKIGFIRL